MVMMMMMFKGQDDWSIIDIMVLLELGEQVWGGHDGDQRDHRGGLGLDIFVQAVIGKPAKAKSIVEGSYRQSCPPSHQL
ncbi:hypothetical protein GBA52_006430 [Prunus armeniaca]|nr:hypothetical protein GBA52_006430 [Prunus armeniaca]